MRAERDRMYAYIGLLLTVVPLIFVISGINQSFGGSEFPFLESFDSPLIILGGLTSALLLNLVAVLSGGFKRSQGVIEAKIKVRDHVWNWVVIGISSILLFIVLAYALMENFPLG